MTNLMITVESQSHNYPELPDPNFAKVIILMPDAKARDKLIFRLREKVAAGLAAEARVRVTRFVFGPPSPWPIAFRVMGPDPAQVRFVADQVLAKAQTNPMCDRRMKTGGSEPLLHTSLSIRTGCG
jgi:multidrug efflux pump subunit AcrB